MEWTLWFSELVNDLGQARRVHTPELLNDRASLLTSNVCFRSAAQSCLLTLTGPL